MFATVPVYNASLQSEARIIRLDSIEEVMPTANVPVDPGAVETAACQVRFFSGTIITVLLDMATMQTRLQALTGIVDEFGTLT